MSAFINLASMRFHSDTLDYPITIFNKEDMEYNFGIIDLHISDNVPIITAPLRIFITIDSSASMSDIGSDGKTKMSHIHHTLENMLRHFHANQECAISVYIQSFDTTVKPIITDITNIRDADIEMLTQRVRNIIPEGSTDIELALHTTSINIASYLASNPHHEIVHLFLTDGDITRGSNNYDVLLGWVPKCCTNIFIGYGIHHNSKLLSHLSSEINNEYKFIDALENAALVYGEIIHGLLYKALEHVTLTIENGELYNYKTNNWEPTLTIGNLLSDQTKTYHVRSKTPEYCKTIVYGVNIIRNRKHSVPKEGHLFLKEETKIATIKGSNSIDNLDVYILRQKTQELLYKARTSYADLDQLKEELREFHKRMITYMKDTHLDNDSILKMCCDDIYIAFMTAGTAVGEMFTCARQTSNGQQQTYMCSQIQSPDCLELSSPIPLQRQVADPGLQYWIQRQDILTQTDYDTRPNTPLSPLFKQTEYETEDKAEADADDIHNYVLSQSVISPFLTSRVVSLMRDISGNNSIDKKV
jgi:hypothetical protein